MANTVLHPAVNRGLTDHGWLQSHQSFSFGLYVNPERIRFGALRVLNDDVVAGAMGFGEHPHDNMEIISIPLAGVLEHRDSMGNQATIRPGEIQVMSAGTGVYHSEYNKDKKLPAQFLQIWIFPNVRNVSPRYDQLNFSAISQINQLQQILSPFREDEGVWIYQDAWMHIGDFEEGNIITYALKKPGNGLYFFVIDGEVNLLDHQLQTRDALGISETDDIQASAKTKAKVLLIEVPMILEP